MKKTIAAQYKALHESDQKIYNHLKFAEKIDGWLFVDEIVVLYKLVKTYKKKNAIFCEIGSWLGKSLSIMGRAALDRGDAMIYGIDPFDGSGDRTSKKDYSLIRKGLKISQLDTCKNNLNKVRVSSVVKLLPYASDTAIFMFEEKKIDGLFIDGNHDFKYVMKDINLWSPMIVRGGWLILHDVKAVHVEGPRKAMNILKRNKKQWHGPVFVGEMAIFHKN